jgi:hypothetical protein
LAEMEGLVRDLLGPKRSRYVVLEDTFSPRSSVVGVDRKRHNL